MAAVGDLKALAVSLDFAIPGPGPERTFVGFTVDDLNALVTVADPLRERLAELVDEFGRVVDEVDELKKIAARRRATSAA